MLLTATVFNGSCSSFHQWSSLYHGKHPASFSQIGQLWIFGQNPAAQLNAWILVNWNGSQVDWVVSLDHWVGSQVDLVGSQDHWVGSQVDWVWFKILPHSSTPGFWPTGMGPRSTGLCPWTTGLGPRSTWLGPRQSLPLGTHCVFSTHAYCFARIVLITYAFTVKGRILLLPGILSEL